MFSLDSHSPLYPLDFFPWCYFGVLSQRGRVATTVKIIQERCFLSCHKHGTKKSLHEESKHRPSDSVKIIIVIVVHRILISL